MVRDRGRALLFAVVTSITATMGGFAASGASAQTARTSPATEPEVLVRHIYDGYITKKEYEGPGESFYSPRLKSLVAAARRAAKGDEPCGMEFDFWVNGQDYSIKHVDVIRGPTVPGQRTSVTATFHNIDATMKIIFDFRYIGGRWLLNDAQSVGGGEKWTLSRLLQCQS